MTDRYSRHKLFAPIGEEGQRKLRHKHVLIVGAGALGTGNAEAMARAGIGKLTIVDRDYVEWSNLQRQQLYSEHDAQQRLPKAVAAAERLQQINSEVELESKVIDVTPHEIEPLTDKVDLILDATDNFDTRMIINDISQKRGIPWIYGACVGSYGLSYVIRPGLTPCLHCLLETLPLGGATCDTVGIIAPAVQMVVAYQTAEAFKLLVGDTEALRNQLVSFDLWKNQHTAIRIEKMKKPDCPSCGKEPSYPFLQASQHAKAAVLCGRDTVQIRPPGLEKRQTRNLDELAGRLAAQGGTVEQNPFLLSWTIDHRRMVIFQDGRVLIHGTKDIAEAKSLYHRYLG